MKAYPKIFKFDIKENFQHFKLILDDSSYSKNKDDGPTSLEPLGLIQYTLDDDKIDVFSNIALFEGFVNDIKSIIWKKLATLVCFSLLLVLIIISFLFFLTYRFLKNTKKRYERQQASKNTSFPLLELQPGMLSP